MSLVSKSENRTPMLDSGVSNSLGNYGMQSQSSARSGMWKPIARSVKDVQRKDNIQFLSVASKRKHSFRQRETNRANDKPTQ